jgi:hypothetical protein
VIQASRAILVSRVILELILQSLVIQESRAIPEFKVTQVSRVTPGLIQQ